MKITAAWNIFRSFLPATKKDLSQLKDSIMSVISDFLKDQSAFQDTVDSAIEGWKKSIEGIAGDIKAQNDQIAKLQSTPGTFTTEDQTLVDSIQARGQASAAKLTAITTQLAEIDALTPPTPPPVA